MLSVFGNIIGRPLDWFLGQSPVNRSDGTQSTSSSSASSSYEDLSSTMASTTLGPYEPAVLDVIVVKAMLNQALSLPLELIDIVLDMAEYWPHSTTIDRTPRNVMGGRKAAENLLLAISNPLGFNRPIQSPNVLRDNRHSFSAQKRPLEKPYTLEQWQKATGSPGKLLEHPCRKIVFSIRSHDQGWSSEVQDHGTYTHSWTWFDAGLERLEGGSDTVDLDGSRLRSIWPEVRERADAARHPPSPSADASEPSFPDPAKKAYELHHELLPNQEHMIQANVHAKRAFTDHKVVWSWTDDIDPESPQAEGKLVANGRGKATGNGEFVRGLTVGDVVSVWGRARFGAWHNTVERVQIDVYWAV